ncbi:acetyl-CoA carboxylase biotin carboxyl carrier protein subunit [Rhodohalobacter sp. SW132]|uniref:acetyl-CoA carboxylase biotin carboxyl carrier protein subunit n=1 Tax=Rhodohalobacter sp. SW132 TaxID=2293433 RepID=UPI0013158251|nr:acetyl-CoA carboxylase biotin carboxyl carrier protein subunit [Rhodohalobacter sp. SW132]
MQFETTIGESIFDVLLNLKESEAEINDQQIDFEIVEQNELQIIFRTGHQLHTISNISVDNGTIECTVDGKWITAQIKNEQQLLLERLGFKTNAEKSVGSLEAPMPGKILELLVEEGAEVELGDPVAILEAMKMENELKAPCAGTIAEISVTTGTNVEKNQLLIEIKPRG